MKVLFLDFDGVVACLPQNSMGERMRRIAIGDGKGGSGTAYAFDRACVARVNRIIAETGAKVVVSSTWRKHYSVEVMTAHLQEAGFVGSVLSSTPVHDHKEEGDALWLPGKRGAEIREWLQAVEYQRPICPKPKGPAVESYVVLDDEYDNDGEYVPRDRWVLVHNGWGDGGLQDEHVEKAVAILGRI